MSFLVDALIKDLRQSNLKCNLKTDQTRDNTGWRGCGGIQACREALDQIFDAFSMVCCSAIRAIRAPLLSEEEKQYR